ncbi:glycosyltransferase [Azoarcus indigens]|uniref:Glycosyltransferase involved in cell wall biosynthesis n=1 Tax=Azoarcus indigens TaxID=29545 RepID=A0A4R6E9W5_9RHOO|nr:glycosyltransferase [Azoarcus indigens]NMG63897.1 glycosyltransferase [Azoarcus indigens]TDN53828.1 glycosyltransferase involved in cell wall biosynthesis [Azoarcus indigens]
MRILFATTHTYLPQRVGGSEASTHDLAKEMLAQGHEPAVLCGLSTGDSTWLRNRVIKGISRKHFPADTFRPYRVFRGYEVGAAAIHEVAASFKPDAAVVQAGHPVPLARALVAAGIPTLLYFRDVVFDRLGGEIQSHPLLRFVANSRFTAAEVERSFNVKAEVIPPLVHSTAYATTRRPRYALFINPVASKGLETVLELAKRNPDIPFLLLESWPLGDEARRSLTRQSATLANVELRRPTLDMKNVYHGARLLLVPSRSPEAWGRVATEAQFSGIPVLASKIGGLPESVGHGGLLVPPSAGIDAWHQALRRIWDNPEQEQALSRAATEYAARAEIRPERLIADLLSVLGQIQPLPPPPSTPKV